MRASALISVVALSVMAATFVLSKGANAYPVDPNKRPVAVGQNPKAAHDFTLMYDHSDDSIVYYAPKGGRVAIMNGMPLLSFAEIPGGGFFNAQLEFGVFGEEKQQLFEAIQKAGYVPVPMPYLRTEVVPITPGYDPTTGERVCEMVVDESTGEVYEDCEPAIFSAISYSRKGPSLGEFVAFSGTLTQTGAMVYRNMLRGGNALQLLLSAEYYKAGTAFTATVTVDYTKLYTALHSYLGFQGYFTSAQLEAVWKQEGLCVGRPADQCSIKIDYVDDRGKHIQNPLIDPEDDDAKKVWQAIERLAERLQNEMLTPVGPSLGAMDTTKPQFGFKLNEQYERTVIQKHATFVFKSPIGVNKGQTEIPTGIACVAVANDGSVSRNTTGDCSSYWNGTLGFDDILAEQLAP